jgi:hypothetical protein
MESEVITLKSNIDENNIDLELINLKLELSEVILNSLEKFRPSKAIKEIILSQIKTPFKGIDEWFEREMTEHMSDLMKDEEWRMRLDAIHDGIYPIGPSQVFFKDGNFVCRPYLSKSTLLSNQKYTIKNKLYKPIKPTRKHAYTLAPSLTEVYQGKTKLIVRAGDDIDLFLNKSMDTIPQSSIMEVESFLIPLLHQYSCIIMENGKLPKKIQVPEFVCKEAPRDLEKEFIDDLGNTLAFDNDRMVGNLIGFLTSPFYRHLRRSENPAFLFLGGSLSGKNFSACTLPQLLYCYEGQESVIVRKLATNLHEFGVALNEALNCPFIIFDEIEHDTPEQMKFLDSLFTADKLVYRALGQGTFDTPNIYTYGMTAVRKPDLTDETLGRILTIEFTESREQEIENLMKKWGSRGAELIRAFYDSLTKVKQSDLKMIKRIKGRRGGFSLMAHLMKEAFDLECDFEIKNEKGNQLLDQICRMASEVKPSKHIKLWKSYAFRSFRDFLVSENLSGPTNEVDFKTLFKKAVAEMDTRKNLRYREKGYEASNGCFYHIWYQEVKDGGAYTRKLIKVKELSLDYCDDDFDDHYTPKNPKTPNATLIKNKIICNLDIEESLT